MSKKASTTVPVADLLGLAFSSKNSASNKTFSNNSSIPVPFNAETSWDWIFPPHSSINKFIPESFSLILSGFEFGLSILFIAKTIGTAAAWAWLIASFVWGIISSSAAITIITKCVTWAPLALIAVKASCPGVSKKVIFWPSFNITL